MTRWIIPVFLLFAIVSCRPAEHVPKPPGYFRLDTPAAHEYRLFNDPRYPYSFEYPVYSKIETDSAAFEDKPDNPYWMTIVVPGLGATINLTYKEINEKQPLARLASDSWGMSAFHEKKAEYIREKDLTDNSRHVAATLYVVGGNAASRYQFTATDSVKHFIRGALYFNVTPNADSLKPATDFLEQDIKHLLMTIRWKY